MKDFELVRQWKRKARQKTAKLNRSHLLQNDSNRVASVCLVSLILKPFDVTNLLTKIFVDNNRFNKGERNEVRTE